jgi:diaminohydroxyphosphoribosylaminopyrimidine deaminase/5-amino-6-(5-phosphoribosylamino)uracil reductase
MDTMDETVDDEGLSQEDLAHLEWARKLARRGWGRVHPNPLVGCVLVREGRMVGEGFHREFGGPHAEIVALEQAGSRAEGATAYVSLEPCDHDAKTPPCAHALLRAGVSRVIYGVADPDETASGGAETLRRGGVEVVGPVWNERVGRAENPELFHTRRHKSPYVALKLAMSLDGYIAAKPGACTRITGVEAEREVHRLRTGFDGVLVGAGTVRADDPRLTVRMAPAGRNPVRRMVLDARAELPVDCALFDDIAEAPLHIFTRHDADEGDIERLESAGAHVHPVPHDAGGLDLQRVLDVAWEAGIESILCEGGARLAEALLREGRIQRLYLLIAPTTLGTGGVSAFPQEAKAVEWSAFFPACAPQVFGRDTLIVLDKEGD